MKLNYKGPVVLAIMDGVGLRREMQGNAVKLAHTEFLNQVVGDHRSMGLEASGAAVGILPGDMGNSEVGHNAIGSGQIIKQGIANIENAFADGSIWQTKAWQTAINRTVAQGNTLHFAGIFSDGKVHSTLDHLKKMIEKAHAQGVRKIRVHAVLDGRDVPPQSAEKYIADFENFVRSFPDQPDYQIASGGGRMVFVADRYENDWGVVKNGWDAIVHGEAPHQFEDALTAVNTFRSQDPALQDQYVPPFVIIKDGAPVGRVQAGDAFIYFDFRADRAIEIAEAFTYYDFPHFDRGKIKEPNNNEKPYSPDDVFFAGMTEYNSDNHVPEHQLIPPVQIKNTLNQFLGSHGISQLAVAETVKFGHVTYYFNGNSYEKAPGEEQIEIPSDTLPFDTRPWMKSAETTDVVIDNLEKYRFIRLNFPGGDMVGHFAELEPTITAIEAIDIQLARLAREVDRLGGVLVITADHGNAEELMDVQGVSKTSHTTNPVPFIIYDNTENRQHYDVFRPQDAGLSNIASTLALLLGLDDYPPSWREPLIVTD